jgi:isocitrate dehydrogenase kinase/phosphatase
MQAASQEIQALRQALQEAQSGIAVEQARGQNAQALEAIKAQTAQALQAMKDNAAYDREELKAIKEMLIQQMQPPPQLAQSVSEDIAQQ